MTTGPSATDAEKVPGGADPLRSGVATAAFVPGLIFFGALMIYYASGAGGPTLLAVMMVPLALVVLLAREWAAGEFYPRLRPAARGTLALAQGVAALGAAFYLRVEFEAIRSSRLGLWNPADYLAGATVALLVLDYTRRRYFPVFVINLLLVLYCVYGYMAPGLLHHPGLSWRRVVSAVSLEMTTGVFERLAQLGLTLIGSFLLLLAVLRAFGCVDSILGVSARLAARSPRLLPQAAVLGSFGVAAVSGSGAANAATTGAATIPLFIKAGFTRVQAAAIETASSLGGQLMPPLMGISAFLMAELLGVGYVEVVARGFAPALIYYAGVALGVYLLSARLPVGSADLDLPPARRADWANLAVYVGAVVALIWLMGVQRQPAMVAAQQVFLGLLVVLGGAFLWRQLRARVRDGREWVRPFVRLVETFAQTTAELTLLLASLGILTAAFTVTGIPDKLGVLLLQLADFNLVLMIITAFAFGYLIGMGLPVTPTYIVLAVVTVPFMVRAGVDPWVAHFFAFFVAVFGELSPPTSVTAAVTSRIANASFTRVMWRAMGLCLPLLVLMAAIFTRPDLVVEPGRAQAGAFVLVLIGTLGLVAALQGVFSPRAGRNRFMRAGLAALSLGALLLPDARYAAACAGVLLLTLLVLGVRRRRERRAGV
jgi:TRAP transporter 4TM/12TM fusion protein